MDIVVWLRSLGLGKCEAVFRENEIDETVLPSFTEEHLKQLGVTCDRTPGEAARICRHGRPVGGRCGAAPGAGLMREIRPVGDVLTNQPVAGR